MSSTSEHVEIVETAEGRVYTLNEIIGGGRFGRIVAAKDVDGKALAMKLIPPSREANALQELENLQKIKDLGGDQHHCISLVDHFKHGNFHALVFPRHICLRKYMTEELTTGRFSCQDARHIAKQLVEAVAFLHRNSIIHLDLKPENMVLVDEVTKIIKLIDFGSVFFINKPTRNWAATKSYQGPEIFLGIGFGMYSDVWAIGCIIFELYTGRPLFPANVANNRDGVEMDANYLHLMEKRLGDIPFRMKHYGFETEVNQHKGLLKKVSFQYGGHIISVRETEMLNYIRQYIDPMERLLDQRSHPWLNYILRSMLQMEPEQRCRLSDILSTPFFQ